MRLKIEETEVVATYLPFVKAAGAVMQLLLHPSEQRDSLHKKLVVRLEFYKPAIGVMDNSVPVDGYTEIRILNASILETVDLIRMVGFGVQEIHPHL